jgi:ElaB/YqjD/DUF883 family membrane-anchored ribosome-binding protein
MSEMLNRLGSLETEKLAQIEKMLKAQQVIDKAVDPTNSPLGKVNESLKQELTNTLAGRAETIRMNLTQLLGFTPTSDDVKELVKVQNSFGGSLTNAVNVIAKNINQIEGGISSFLQSIDTGITEGLTAAAEAVDKFISDAQKEIESAIKSLLPTPESLLPEGTLSQLKDIINDVNALADKVTNMITAQIDSAMQEVDNILNGISDEINTATKNFLDTNINIISSQVDGFKNAVNSSATSAPTPPIPPNADNQQPAVVPLQPPRDVSPAPITPPQPAANDLRNRLDNAYSEEIRQLQRSGRAGDAWGLNRYDYRVINRLPQEDREAAIALSGLSRNEWQARYGDPNLLINR